MLDRIPAEISIADGKKNFTQIFRKLSRPVTVTRHGEPVGIILSMEEYDRLSRMATLNEILELRKKLPKNGMTASEAYRQSKKMIEDRSFRYRR